MDQDRVTNPDLNRAPVESSPVSAVVRPVGSKPSGAARAVNVALGIAVVLAIGGIAFAVGRGTAPTQASSNPLPDAGAGLRPNASFAPGLGGGLGRGFGGGLGNGLSVEGTVVSRDGDTIEIETGNGQPISVGLDAGTEYHRQASGSPDDVAAGSTVIVRLEVGLPAPGAAGASAAPGLSGASASDVTVVP